MKRVSIAVEEQLRYSDEVIVLQPDSMSDNEFENLISKAENTCRRTHGSVSDFVIILEELGLEVTDHSISFPDSPSDIEFEITDVMDID